MCTVVIALLIFAWWRLVHADGGVMDVVASRFIACIRRHYLALVFANQSFQFASVSML